MEEVVLPQPRRRRLLAKFTGAALIGFVISAAILHLGLQAGLRPWSARLIALLCAMNVTFLINGRFVFRALTRQRFLAQWAAYTANSAIGNSCNYWVFVTLESTHRPVIGNPYLDLLAGSAAAWAINFTGARLVVFGDGARRLGQRCMRVLSARGLAVTPGGQPNLDRLAGDRLGGEGVLGWDRRAVAEQAAPETHLVALELPAAAVTVVAAAHGGVGPRGVHPQLGGAAVGIGRDDRVGERLLQRRRRGGRAQQHQASHQTHDP